MNDLDEIMAKVNENTTQSKETFNKNAWVEQKQKERSDVYKLIDTSADEIKNDLNKYLTYLEIQGRFDKYSVGNSLLISSQMPNATQLKDFNDWKEQGAFIKKAENGIKILEPGDPYTRRDGTNATSYNVKKLFDISQTSMSNKVRKNNYDEKLILTALLKDCPVNIKAVDEIPDSTSSSLWNKDEGILYVKRGEDTSKIFKELASELVKASLEETGNSELDNFKAKSTAYMLCKKYGIDVSDITIDKIPDSFKEMTSSEVRNELSSMRNSMEDINTRMSSYFETMQKKEKNKDLER
jgi:hypothetical protein